jgi:hypothetical protein
MRSIEVSAKLNCPPHPLGAAYNSFGYPLRPYVYWPPLS